MIGLGYVGLPLAVSFAQAGYDVIGIDLDRRKVEAINSGESYIEDVPAAVVQALVQGQAQLTLAGEPRSGSGVRRRAARSASRLIRAPAPPRSAPTRSRAAQLMRAAYGRAGGRRGAGSSRPAEPGAGRS